MEYHLKSIDQDKNRYRFYSIVIQPDLFGKFSLIRRWGRIGTKGRSITTIFESFDQVNKEVNRLLQTRARHGYVKVEPGKTENRRVPGRNL